MTASIGAASAARAHPVLAPPADVPIRIDRCALLSRTELRDPFNGIPAEYVSGLTIRFVNVRTVAATLVRLSVRYEGASETIVDHGVFAPNVPIEREFATFAGARSGGDPVVCSVLSAAYSDGTGWTGER